MTNFIKITFHDIDFKQAFRLAINDASVYIIADAEPHLCKNRIAGLVYAAHIRHCVTNDRIFHHSTYDYILDNIKVEFHKADPVSTHEDVQIAIDLNRSFVWSL